ncbi:hypothetical protein M885DRAFT_518886 [Pelagophyceae sp. CCMP2097]|nr:hypothetical protein M885DRAFT_518886 [Pelagophyceae sp. CCMP2097]
MRQARAYERDPCRRQLAGGRRSNVGAVEVEESSEPPAFDVMEFPANIDEMTSAYGKWSLSRGITLADDEARSDVMCFMSDEDLVAKWRPVLQDAAKERNKLTPTEMLNVFTSYALPIAVGITVLPVLRSVGEQVPFVNDVFLPQIDAAVALGKVGLKNLINLPICLEFGDC